MAKNILLVYKKNRCWNYVLPKRSGHFLKYGNEFVRRDIRRIRQAHRTHSETLRRVEQILHRKEIRYRAVYHASQCDYSSYDLVIAVGGDGTFLEAARQIQNQPILGVNSDPTRSVGSFCRANRDSFEKIVDRILQGKAKIERFSRLQLKLNGKPLGVNVVNDLLITDRRSAAMNRYWIQVGRVKEEQRSSGIWVSTAVGSTGALKSAGGKALPRGSKAIQYKPRELYAGLGRRYRLSGGIVPAGRPLIIGSLMHEGVICVDGEHLKFPFRYGDVLKISSSPHPLHLIR